MVISYTMKIHKKERKKYNIEAINKIIYPMELLNDGYESFLGCGECETDEYLIDL